MSSRVGGIDPGPKPGLVVLHIDNGVLVSVERGAHLTWQAVIAKSTHVAVETYVIAAASGRRGDPHAQRITQRMALDARQHCVSTHKVHQAVPAGVVKPWADDERLKAYRVGHASRTNQHEDSRPTLYELTRGNGGHDRDAARHALNFAVKLGLLPHR